MQTTHTTLLTENASPHGAVARYWVEQSAGRDRDGDPIVAGILLVIADDGTDEGDYREGPVVFAVRDGGRWIPAEPEAGLDLDELEPEAFYLAGLDYRARHDIGMCPACPESRTVIDRVHGRCPSHAAASEVAA